MSIKYAILGLLQSKDLHGYKIKKLIERDFGFMWTVNYGQIYPALKAMLDEGLLTMSVVATANSPDRKLYSITRHGREAFLDWLSAAPERTLFIRDPFLLRFPFFASADVPIVLQGIDRQIAHYTKQLAIREKALAGRKRGDRYVRLAAELGIRFNRMILDWLSDARAEIANETGALPSIAQNG
jgi:DNA-binding PadR family transcriptional regulator